VAFALTLLFDDSLSRIGQNGGEVLGEDLGVEILVDG
jgi:hypothetical protein